MFQIGARLNERRAQAKSFLQGPCPRIFSAQLHLPNPRQRGTVNSGGVGAVSQRCVTHPVLLGANPSSCLRVSGSPSQASTGADAVLLLPRNNMTETALH